MSGQLYRIQQGVKKLNKANFGGSKDQREVHKAIEDCLLIVFLYGCIDIIDELPAY